ncbi:MAG: quinone-dependent dihydroorotate dehydrogenase [Rhodocyclaceae bacterium]|nr:quinone-dependent dihydroorotate dehydrogenase [Rhodocyclaceae bacterium]MBP6110110.1 quinone-dependent dihydroorotate dehydrogenase [Rhodocyclaceae bacterium]MBP6279878.1 quinone-dependent dihydroorotate dehydrogenase [Rhodocyclaceae bacterium]
MNLYALARPLLFALDAERIHELTLHGLSCAKSFLPYTLGRKLASKPVTVMGLEFPNRVGLAAGLDKNAVAVDGLAAMGFGFLEVGTVTPRPQPGNPKPRMFRLTKQQAIINRMGFNNFGVDKLLANLDKSRFKGILGINIGKNATTAIEDAHLDYLTCLDKVYPRASYVTVNISSPNTKNLRQLQNDAALDNLLSQLKQRQAELAQKHGRYVPLTLKIAPDLDAQQIQQISDALKRYQMDGVIATNTTLSREGVEGLTHAEESGGLSGAPLRVRSTQVVQQLADKLAGEVPIIAVGGIMNGDDALAKINAGAALVQIYSGLIFNGPAMVRECVLRLNKAV